MYLILEPTPPFKLGRSFKESGTQLNLLPSIYSILRSPILTFSSCYSKSSSSKIWRIAQIFRTHRTRRDFKFVVCLRKVLKISLFLRMINKFLKLIVSILGQYLGIIFKMYLINRWLLVHRLNYNNRNEYNYCSSYNNWR